MARKVAPSPARIAMFVEGSAVPTARGRPALENIWKKILMPAMGLHAIDRVIGISKKDILAVFPKDPELGVPIFGTGALSIDRRIRAELDKSPFDVAVIVWDEHPPTAWKQGGKKDVIALPKMCVRWNETVSLYRGLSDSEFLDGPWKAKAIERFQDLSTRSKPGKKQVIQSLEPGVILAVCMAPEFEILLTACESAIKSALGVTISARANWPNWNAWDRFPVDTIRQAIVAAYQYRGHPFPATLPEDYRTAKNEWGEYLISAILDDRKCLERLAELKLVKRFKEVLHSSRVFARPKASVPLAPPRPPC